MRLALVRHGQTNWNIDSLLQGSTDVPLNETGREQAAEAAKLLSDEPWDLVVSSPLQRARDTARVISTTLSVQLGEADPQLVERDYGSAEGMTKEEAFSRFGALWPGTESFESLQTRAVSGITAVAERHAGENLIIVTHGTFIRAFIDSVTETLSRTPANAHSVRLEGEPDRWVVTAGYLPAENPERPNA